MELGVPVAHAPACEVAAKPDDSVAPKAAAEELGFTFLPCVLAYLHRAPSLVSPSDERAHRAIWARDVDAVVVPGTAAGGAACMALAASGNTLVVAVEENETVEQSPPHQLGMMHVSVQNYLEAVGMLAAHKAGVLPAAMTSKILPIQPLSSHKGAPSPSAQETEVPFIEPPADSPWGGIDDIIVDTQGRAGQNEGVSSGETPDSERARAMELRKLGHDPSPVLTEIEGKEDGDRSAGEDKEGEGVSSGETPDSEKARAMELRKLGHDPSSSLDDVVTGDMERGDEGWG